MAKLSLLFHLCGPGGVCFLSVVLYRTREEEDEEEVVGQERKKEGRVKERGWRNREAGRVRIEKRKIRSRRS